jgi:hypothetical protein
MRMKGCAAALASAAAVAAALTTAGTASAARPSMTTSPFSFSAVDTQSCSFPNTQVYTGTVRTIAYADGRVKLFFRIVGTISANGRTLTDSDHYSLMARPDGSAVVVGSIIHIRLPGGGVVADSGRIVLDSSGAVVGFSGRQDQLTGNLGAFCAALS